MSRRTPPICQLARSRGKVSYFNRAQAEKARKRQGRTGLRVYGCECGSFHLTHLKPETRIYSLLFGSLQRQLRRIEILVEEGLR